MDWAYMGRFVSSESETRKWASIGWCRPSSRVVLPSLLGFWLAVSY